MSHLQRAASKVNWLLEYRLRPTLLYDLSKQHLGFQVSDLAIKLAEERNKLTAELRKQLEADYKTHAIEYRKAHKLPLTKHEKQFDG